MKTLKQDKMRRILKTADDNDWTFEQTVIELEKLEVEWLTQKRQELKKIDEKSCTPLLKFEDSIKIALYEELLEELKP